jgi:hypothetical protein
METIKMDKKYQTRDGRAVRILAIDEKSQWSVVGRIMETYGRETLNSWMADGKAVTFDDSPLDLVPVPTKHEAWMPVSYDRDSAYWVNGRLFDSQEEVGITMGRTRIAHVTWED